MTAPVCPYCNTPSVLCDASAVYGPKFEGKGNVWACANYPECDAYVGAAAGLQPTPLGTLANAELRGLRKRLRDRLRFIRDEKPQPTKVIQSQRREFTAQISRVNWMGDADCLAALAGLVGAEE